MTAEIIPFPGVSRPPLKKTSRKKVRVEFTFPYHRVGQKLDQWFATEYSYPDSGLGPDGREISIEVPANTVDQLIRRVQDKVKSLGMQPIKHHIFETEEVEFSMRKYIRIVEQADADNMYGDSALLTTFGRRDGQEFTDRGRADINSKRNNPRFADNSMTDIDPDAEIVNEFASGDIDKLHRELNKVGLDDATIRQADEKLLSHEGKEKIAGPFGISVEDVDLLLSTLIQKLRDEDARSMDALTDNYYSTISEEDESKEAHCSTCHCKLDDPSNPLSKDCGGDCLKCTAAAGDPEAIKSVKRIKNKKKIGETSKKRPFDKGVMTERFSAERDFAGNVTVRDSVSGKERFIQGTEATTLLTQLDHGADPNAVIAPLLEDTDLNHEHSDNGFADEIKASAGTYNFPWDYQGDYGFATVFYRTDVDTPDLRLESVRDEHGDEIEDVSPDMHDELLNQAKEFIGQE